MRRIAHRVTCCSPLHFAVARRTNAVDAFARTAKMSFVAADIPPALVGSSLVDCDTPACVVDLTAIETNLSTALKMVNASSQSIKFRTHMKSHKTPELAMLQQAVLGDRMIGVCCQKVVEAEAMVLASADLVLAGSSTANRKAVVDILVSNQVVGVSKIERLVQLASRIDFKISVLVDDEQNVRDLSAAAATVGASLYVLVEVDVGQKRCGVATTADCVRLATLISSLPGLKFDGIQCYHGGAQHARSVSERTATCKRVSAAAAERRDALIAAGLGCPIVTGGGSGTFHIDATFGVFTELQPGSFIFNDADYARNLDAEGKECWTSPFVPSLFMLSTVMSVRLPTPQSTTALLGSAAGSDATTSRSSDAARSEGWVVLDSGLKAQSVDSGPGVVVCEVGQYHTGAGGALPLAVELLDTSAHPAGLRTVDGTALTNSHPLFRVNAASAGADDDHSSPSTGVTGDGMIAASALRIKSVSDEHSTAVHVAQPAAHTGSVEKSYFPQRGTKLMLMPGHCDPFVNHFDWMVCIRGQGSPAAAVAQNVVAVWRISARSAGS